MSPGLARGPSVGIYNYEDDFGSRLKRERRMGAVPDCIIRASQRKVQAKSNAEKKKRDEERQLMASAARIKCCSVCGTQHIANFDPNAYDNPDERRKWRQWNRNRRCPACEDGGRNPDPELKYCVACGTIIKRREGQNNSSWVLTVKCPTHRSAIPE